MRNSMNNTLLKLVFALLLFAGLSTEAIAQTDQLWTRSSEDRLLLFQKNARKNTPQQERIFKLNLELLKHKLSKANRIGATQRRKSSSTSIPFPDKNGKLHDYEVYELPLLAPGLQEKFPDIRSYIGKSTKAPYHTIRFSIGTSGLHLMKFTTDGDSEFIDPYTKDGLSYTVYAKSELPQTEGIKECLVKEKKHPGKKQPGAGSYCRRRQTQNFSFGFIVYRAIRSISFNGTKHSGIGNRSRKKSSCTLCHEYQYDTCQWYF